MHREREESKWGKNPTLIFLVTSMVMVTKKNKVQLAHFGHHVCFFRDKIIKI
jgi:hypothetical protein